MTLSAFPARTTHLGPLEIRRALPIRERRMVGPWCFLDRYGPLAFEAGKAMDVAPHPHIGIQTVSWLTEGEVFHRDSLGFEALVRPGGVNVMTSGRGIAHSEETPRAASGRLSGVQLWVALPDAERHRAPSFEHHEQLPVEESRGGSVEFIAGGPSPASVYSPILGAALRVFDTLSLPLDPSFEHALFLLEGTASLEGQPLIPDVLYDLGLGRDSLTLTGRTHALLLGGAPFGEPVLMWWNFVARTAEEIAAAREEWERHGERFGEVHGYDGPRIPAPPLRGRAVPNPAS